MRPIPLAVLQHQENLQRVCGSVVPQVLLGPSRIAKLSYSLPLVCDCIAQPRITMAACRGHFLKEIFVL